MSTGRAPPHQYNPSRHIRHVSQSMSTSASAPASSSSSHHGHGHQQHHHHHHHIPQQPPVATPPPPPPATSASSSSEISVSYETMERRYSAVVNLESWELLAMHSIASDESIPRVRLRLLKSLVGLPTEDAVPPTQPGGAGASHGIASSSTTGSPTGGWQTVKRKGGRRNR